MTYAPQYPGGWKDLPDTSTPIVAAALAKIDAALLADDTSIAANTASIAANSSAISALQATTGAMLQKVASTGTAGYTYINGTGPILSWTAPNDGQMHRVLLIGQIRSITVPQTGGAIVMSMEYPDGSGAPSPSVNAGGNGTGGFHAFSNSVFLIQPGSTITLQQSTAQTTGSTVLWAELWAS